MLRNASLRWRLMIYLSGQAVARWERMGRELVCSGARRLARAAPCSLSATRFAHAAQPLARTLGGGRSTVHDRASVCFTRDDTCAIAYASRLEQYQTRGHSTLLFLRNGDRPNTSALLYTTLIHKNRIFYFASVLSRALLKARHTAGWLGLCVSRGDRGEIG